MSATLKDNPIGFVLERLWADLTEGGRVDVNRRIQEMLAVREYGAAMMLAIALELDTAKREESDNFWSSDAPSRTMALDEMGRRTLFSFLMLHQNDWKTIGRPIEVSVSDVQKMTDLHNEINKKPGPPPMRPLIAKEELSAKQNA